MKRYTFYVVVEKFYSNCFGADYKIHERDYCTNEDGSGVFYRGQNGLNQLTGNCQFSGGRKKLLRWLNSDAETRGEWFFITKLGAERFAAKKRDENPLVKKPFRHFSVGEKCIYYAEDVFIVGQNGPDVEIEYPDEPGYTTTVKYYDLF